MSKQYYAGQEVLGLTSLPRSGWALPRHYFWMRDGDGVIYLVKAKRNKGLSVGSDGEVREFTEEFEPDFT